MLKNAYKKHVVFNPGLKVMQRNLCSKCEIKIKNLPVTASNITADNTKRDSSIG